jgi:hypothetical protein
VASRLPGKFVLPLGLEIWVSCRELVSYFRTKWKNAIDKVTDAAVLVLSEELREIVREKRRKRGPSVETGSLVGNHLGHQTVCFVKNLVKIHKNIENT